MTKKNTTTLILVIIIVLAIIATIIIKNNNKQPIQEVKLSPSDIQLEAATKSDTTASINQAINDINVDTTSDKDLIGVDTEIKSL